MAVGCTFFNVPLAAVSDTKNILTATILKYETFGGI
jgi:hypothetical protein